MSRRTRRGAALIAALGGLLACKAVASSVAGHGEVHASSSTIAVGDSVQLTAGVQYQDGRFVPFSSATITSSAPAVASYDATTRYLRGNSAGTTRVQVAIRDVGTFDTLFTVVAAP